jgi:uncharacterized membrane-anchored protein
VFALHLAPREVKTLTGTIRLSKKAKCEFGEKGCLTAQHHFALRLLFTGGIKKIGEATGEVAEKRAFIYDGAKVQGTGGSQQTNRGENNFRRSSKRQTIQTCTASSKATSSL